MADWIFSPKTALFQILVSNDLQYYILDLHQVLALHKYQIHKFYTNKISKQCGASEGIHESQIYFDSNLDNTIFSQYHKTRTLRVWLPSCPEIIGHFGAKTRFVNRYTQLYFILPLPLVKFGSFRIGKYLAKNISDTIHPEFTNIKQIINDQLSLQKASQPGFKSGM